MVLLFGSCQGSGFWSLTQVCPLEPFFSKTARGLGLRVEDSGFRPQGLASWRRFLSSLVTVTLN